MRGQRVDDFGQIARHHPVERIERQVDPVIGHPPLGKVIGADAFAAVARSDLALAVGGAFAVGARAFHVVKARPQHRHGVGAVLVLRLLGTGDHDPAWQVGDPDRRIGGVDVLTARARGAIGVDADIGGGDVDIDLLGLGQNGHGRRRGMDAPARFGFRHPLHAMHAGFVFQPGEDALALDPGRGFLDPAKLGLGEVEHLEGPALRLGIAAIHGQKIAREQRRLLAAGAGADLDDGRARIGGILGQKRDAQRLFQIGQFRLEARHFLLCQFAHVGIREHRLRLGQPVTGGAPFADLGHHRLQIGIFAADRGDLIGGGAGIQLRFEKLETLGNLDKAIFGQHLPQLPPRRLTDKAQSGLSPDRRVDASTRKAAAGSVRRSGRR